jgi:hypothetical protein
VARRLVPLLALAAPALGLASACSPSATYLGSASEGHYFKVPPSWHVVSREELGQLALPSTHGAAAAKAQGDSYFVYVGLAAGSPRLGAAGLTGGVPWALGLVQSLGSQDQASLSLAGLQDEVFNPDSASQQGVPVTQLAPTDVVVRGGLRGTRVAYEIDSPDGSIAFEQEAVTNSPTDKVWAVLVGCSPACFRDHRAVASRIVGSFTVTGTEG